MMPIQIRVQMFIYHYKYDLFINYLWLRLILGEFFWSSEFAFLDFSFVLPIQIRV